MTEHYLFLNPILYFFSNCKAKLTNVSITEILGSEDYIYLIESASNVRTY